MFPQLRTCRHTVQNEGTSSAKAVAALELQNLETGSRQMQILALCPDCAAALERYVREISTTIAPEGTH